MQQDQNSEIGFIPSERMWWGRDWGVASVRRSQGDSFFALVSFITGIATTDERTGTRYSIDHPNKLPGYIVSAPEKAPARFTNRRQLATIANEIERSEILPNSVVGHYWLVIANRQHSEFDHFAVVMQVANEIAKRYLVFVVASIDKADDGQTLHYHFGCNVRRIGSTGIGRKVKQMNRAWYWGRERTWFSRAVAAATMQHHGIFPREEENYEQEIVSDAPKRLLSIRRRDFRNGAWCFEKPLKFPGVQAYLQQTFPGNIIIEDVYRIIGAPMRGEPKHRLRAIGLLNRAEAYAHVLRLPGVEAYLMQTFKGEKEATALHWAYHRISQTDFPPLGRRRPPRSPSTTEGQGFELP